MEGSQALERRSVATATRKGFAEEQIALISQTVAKGATRQELAMFLELASRYELDPFAGQIWFTKMPGSNGEEGRPAIIVGRDGFLTIANRHPDYEGFDSDVVCKNDSFKKWTDEGIPKVEHSYDAADEEARGEIVGAWCIVYRAGRRPRYFFAKYREYVPRSERKLKYSPWSTQPTVMIEKCAITTAHRLAFNITGLVGEEEASNVLLRDQVASETFDYADDPELAARLVQLFATANELREGAFLPPKQRMLLRGKSDDERREVAAEIEAWIVKHDGEVPEPPEPMASAEVVEEGEIVEPVEGEDDSIPFAPEMDDPERA